ncbi:MAG: SIMPL domain-containing protein [Micavibrio sp.]|nr:SIMPL domain-containing protein [Micavibrio sp.]|tara:strand:- start:3098 stop:3853 length:756 start_codon:yes stop_codon:yes gene_type:complete
MDISHNTNRSVDKGLTIGLVLLSLSIFFAGFMIAGGMKEFRSADRSVNMKGLAQKDVEADLAIWTIKHSATGNDLSTVQATIKDNGGKIRSFLRLNGLGEKDIASRRLEVTDLLAQTYRQNGATQSRYIVSEVIAIRSENVNAVDAAYQKSGDLLEQNVSLITEQNQSPVEYIFTGLNNIKPDMIAQATKSAREAAEQFAADSGARIGGIRSAYQGMFQILPRDSNNSYQERQSRYKTVRVVSTINFAITE